MRNFLIAALLLAASGPAHAQYFSFNAGSGGPIEIVIPRPYGDPSGIYVHVPGYVEFGRRNAPPPREAYYGPPPGYPQQQGYAPPGAPPDYADDDEAPVYAPPPADAPADPAAAPN